MKNSKLVKLLSVLSTSEMDGFGAYLKAFHGGEGAPVSLYEYLRPFHPAFPAKELEKGRIEKKLGLPHTNGHKRVSNEASKLYAWLLDFLAWEKFRSEENKFEYFRMLLQSLREKKQEQAFFSVAQKASDWLDEAPASACKPLQYMQLGHSKYYYTPTKKWETRQEGIEEVATQLHHFCYTANLKYVCELRSRARALQEKESIAEKYRLKDLAHSEQHLVLARLYSLCEKMLEHDTDENYQNFYDAFLSNEGLLDKEDEHVLLTYLINAIARRLPRDQEQWGRPAFMLYQHGLDKGVLITDGYLSDITFHNIIQLASGVQELQWAEWFVGVYADFLVAEGRDSTLKLARARIAFEQGDFSKPLELLRELEFKDYSFTLQAKVLQARCFYELGERELLDAFMKSFDLSLLRNKVVNKKGALNAYRNFLKVLKKLADGHSRRKIEAALEKYDHLVCKSWLKCKLQSLPE